jgi:exopolysaccharide biosynthesis polyprenyl glycosylphosphotransferase
MADRLQSDARLGYRVEHTISTTDQTRSSLVEDLKMALTRSPIDEVMVTLPPDHYASEIREIINLCERQGILLRLETQPYNVQITRLDIDELEGVTMLTIQSGPKEDWHLLTKRLMDLIGGVVFLVLLSPVFLLVAVLIKLDSSGPVFFKQARVGLNRRRFQLFKFRTMVDGAHRQQAALEQRNEVTGPVFKIRRDPRVTRIGLLLRRFSIDELPQLLNVIRGEMSLVGPRPLPVRDVERIDSLWQQRRFSVKPGITCLWQVSGRSDVSFDRWVRMDLEYIDRWSLELDLKILLRTISAVVKASGAY